MGLEWRGNWIKFLSLIFIWLPVSCRAHLLTWLPVVFNPGYGWDPCQILLWIWFIQWTECSPEWTQKVINSTPKLSSYPSNRSQNVLSMELVHWSRTRQEKLQTIWQPFLFIDSNSDNMPLMTPPPTRNCLTQPWNTAALTELFFMNWNWLLKPLPWAGPVHLVILSSWAGLVP